MSKSELMDKLPSFRKPPVIEVVASLQFSPLQNFTASTLGLYRARIRKKFPHTEDKPPLGTEREEFGAPTISSPSIEISTQPITPRCWYVNEGGDEVIQLQKDRFVYNWRKQDANSSYPRFGELFPKFCGNISDFQEFAAEEELGALAPNLCELTYINIIEPNDIWCRHGELGKILTIYREDYSDSFLEEPEDVKAHLRYRISDDLGQPIGRLHVDIEPRIRRSDQKPVVQLTMTAKGIPAEPSVEKAQEFLQLGHMWIVRGFAAITTPEMHKYWEKE